MDNNDRQADYYIPSRNLGLIKSLGLIQTT